jgi:hypothetical protein
MGPLTASRRDFLQRTTAGTLGALAAGYPHETAQAAAKAKPKATADTVIVLWMAGGMAHTDTFDPKRYTPFKKGLNPADVLSTFPAIPTAVDNIKFTKGLEKMAAVMDRGTLIRTYNAGDLGFILHSRHQFHWHTCYEPPLTVAAPHLGAWIARTLGPKNPAIPAFLDIGQNMNVGESEALKAFHTAGFLGTEFGPFFLPNPAQAIQAVRPARGMTKERFAARYRRFKQLVDDSPIGRAGSQHQRDSLLRALENANRLLTSPEAAKAFDLSLEPKKSYDIYNTGTFGQGCLLARRLTEAGARFIEVTTGYGPFKKWDMHDNGHTRMVGMKKSIDAPIAQLVLDLEERGLLDRTLIVLASEFSRDMMTEGRPGKKVRDQVAVPKVVNNLKFYGMHRHFTSAGTVLMYGGGVKKGFAYGETAEERPVTTTKNPVKIADLHASIYHAMGIGPDHHYLVEKRPFYVTPDGLGRPVKALFS